MSEGSVFDVTLSKTYFEPPKPPLDVKNTTVVLDVIFVGQMPTFAIKMYLFILLMVWLLIILLEMKQNNSFRHYFICDNAFK